jgi:X-X-X-Leu-X-X-Gly heptad repeat protein
VYIPTVGEGAPTIEGHNSLNFFRYGEDGSGNPQLSPPVSTAPEFSFGSGSPIVTSNGTANGSGVVWIVDCLAKGCGGTQGVELRAYTAVPSGASPEPFWRAKIKSGTKFSRPLANAGHIYVGNQEGHIIAFGGPMLTPSPESPQFTAIVGKTTTQEITLTATGTEVEIKEARSPTAPFSVSGLPHEGTALKPGEAIKVKVSFTPTARGSAKGELAILTKQGSETKVALSGTGEPTAQETAEQQQRERERTEREARETSEAAARASVTSASLVTPPAGTGPLSIEPVPMITKLKLRASASRLASHRRKLVATYTLSAPGRVVVVIYRRVVSHSCPRGATTCGRWVATRLMVKVAGHVGANTLAVKLGTLSSGTYRLAATPLTRSGARGATRYLQFKTLP